MIVIEAWTFAHGRAPGVNNRRVQEICDDYWRACGGQPIADGDRSNWRRPLEDALADQDTLHRYIRDEIRLCAAEQPKGNATLHRQAEMWEVLARPILFGFA